ncbi:MAG: hypothetical protein JOY61_24400, partial [Chloroflexi bacterium]|nr:hypothetical protein [Chloroflexota bacterium]
WRLEIVGPIYEPERRPWTPKPVELRRKPEICRDEGGHDWEFYCDECRSNFIQGSDAEVWRECYRCGLVQRFALVTDGLD